MIVALLFALAILVAGLSLGHAAVVPLVLGTAAGPARAWAVAASRMKELIRTALVRVPLVALGMLFGVVPGAVLAMGFAFAMPVVICEGLWGRAALDGPLPLVGLVLLYQRVSTSAGSPPPDSSARGSPGSLRP